MMYYRTDDIISNVKSQESPGWKLPNSPNPCGADLPSPSFSAAGSPPLRFCRGRLDKTPFHGSSTPLGCSRPDKVSLSRLTLLSIFLFLCVSLLPRRGSPHALLVSPPDPAALWLPFSHPRLLILTRAGAVSPSPPSHDETYPPGVPLAAVPRPTRRCLSPPSLASLPLLPRLTSPALSKCSSLPVPPSPDSPPRPGPLPQPYLCLLAALRATLSLLSPIHQLRYSSPHLLIWSLPGSTPPARWWRRWPIGWRSTGFRWSPVPSRICCFIGGMPRPSQLKFGPPCTPGDLARGTRSVPSTQACPTTARARVPALQRQPE